MELTLGQQTILEREINRTYDTVMMLFSVLTSRREVLDIGSVKLLSEGLKQLAEDVQGDRARAAQLSDLETSSVQAVQLAVLHTIVGSIPPIPDTSSVKVVYDAALRALQEKFFSAA